jgi:uncharacterized protein (TIGR02453 family)
VQDIIDRAAKLDPSLAIQAKDAIFRINKDVRFSQDKTPYKLQCSALIAPGGKKLGMSTPGMYLELGPEHFRFYSGLYMLEKDQLQRVREYIMKNSKDLDKLVAEKQFVEHFGELRGEKNKVLPKEFKEAAEAQALLFNKQFYFFSSMPPETILKDDLSEVVMKKFKASEPMRNYLSAAIKA